MATNFYTQNGWEGKNYRPEIKSKQVAQLLREYIKKDAELNRCKWSVTTSDCGLCADKLTVALMAAPFEVFTEEYKRTHASRWERGYSEHATVEEWTTRECQQVINKVRDFVTSYIHDDSDGMIDYFDRNIYDRYEIGKWDKPFARIEEAAPKKTPKAAKKTISADGMQLIDYSEKALAVIGDTKAVKDALKALGGKFNPRLSCGAGWIFSKKKENELRALIAG
jgi:hypothetical protein